MKTRVKVASTMLLFALVLSLVPAAATPSSVSAAQACTDRAQFLADVTVPDGTRFDPGAAFKKTWRLKNVGTCTWTTAYTMVFDTGEKMGNTTSVNFQSSVVPGANIELSVDMTAPSAPGRYIGYWKFKNAAGALFGIGVNANKSWWVEINVTGTPTTNVVFNFTDRAGEATWSSGAGGLSFPGTDPDAKGFALKRDKPKFESGVEAAQAGLLFAPQNITNGYIQARYPAFRVESGDRFQTTVGCEFGATSCYVAYRLDYEVGTTVRTFWTFRERYEGWTYNANLDLSALAGQDVRFILYMSAYGSPVGDRAIWGSPVIVRRGSAPPPTVTGTPPTATPTRTPGQVTVPPSACDKAQFIADVTVPDGTIVNAGTTFKKTWRLKNVGTCAWSTSYQLVFFSGQQMDAPSSAAFPQNVAVGQTIDISVDMKAPPLPGSYRGYWMFKNANGALFGIGSQANKPWWVDINVLAGPTVTPGGPTNTPTITVTPGGPTVTPGANMAYDFAGNACSATWVSGAGTLPCPGSDPDAKGFVLKLSSAKLESPGAIDSRPALLTFPQNTSTGYIQATFPAFRVQNGDRFRSRISCEGGSTSCYVEYRFQYQIGSEPVRVFRNAFRERHEGNFFDVDVDLSFLAGRDVKFILSVHAYNGSATGDRALWIAPHIYRLTGGTVVPATTAATTATATATAGAATATQTATPTATGSATATATVTATPTPTNTP